MRLYAPRRFGKTSLLRKALAEAERSGDLVPVLVDLYGVLSFADVTIRIERAYAQLRGGIRRTIESILRTTGLGLSLGAPGISVKLQLDPRTDPLPALHALLDLPERVAERSGTRVLVALDEFQDIAKVQDFDKLLRSHIQHQGEAASYIFCGSEPGMMRELFDVKGRPLYGQAQPLRLGRLPDAEVAAYVEERFARTKRSAAPVLDALLATARGHPQRAMLLAHRLWDEVAPGKAADEDDWQTALARTRAQVAAEFDALWRGLEANEQRALPGGSVRGAGPRRGRPQEVRRPLRRPRAPGQGRARGGRKRPRGLRRPAVRALAQRRPAGRRGEGRCTGLR